MKDKSGNNQERKLTEKEKERKIRYEAISAELEQKGYIKKECTADPKKVNIISIIVTFAIFALGVFAFYKLNPEIDIFGSLGVTAFVVLMIIGFIVLTVVHELIHGLTFSLFTPKGFKNIDFGFDRKNFMPYCTCDAPIHSGGYLLASLMPLILLGIILTIIAFCVKSYLILVLGLAMIAGAMGDIIVSWLILKNRSKEKETLVLDHPTNIGCYIYEK